MSEETVLLVAAGGGHLAELVNLAARVPWIQKRRWVVSRTPQSELLLQGEDIVWVPEVGVRDIKGVIRSWSTARSLIGHDISAVISTGSAIALGYLPVAASLGVPAYYIETATRLEGPSMSGRLLQLVPGVSLHTQSRRWASRRWQYAGSIFDGFEPSDAVDATRPVRTAVVTLGTMENYGFRRLIERLLLILPEDVAVTWQTGGTDVSGLPIHGRVMIPHDELRQLMVEADVVIGHCGCGTALASLDLGIHPVLSQRKRSFGEHIDDHQSLLGTDLTERGLATVVDADDLEFSDLVAATGQIIRPVVGVPPLKLPPRSESGRLFHRSSLT